ncbi:MAG TPA: glycoside hydrolase family 15 protein [Acidimicrobiales bacterium]|nr:glycoside hydrolase family 15 protein [Acidimicrobiales bacterium]
MTAADTRHSGRGLLPIEDYALLGDTRTAALVASDGSIDWLCVPRFDGQPLFGRLVGGPAAGTFRLGPSGPSTVVSRRYLPHSTTVETTWADPHGRLTLTEGLVAEVSGRLLPSTLLVRRLSAEGGPVEAVVDFDPRLGETRRPPRARYRNGVLVCSWAATAVALHVTPSVPIEAGRPTTVTVTPGEPLTVALTVADREPLVHVDPAAAWSTLGTDERRWRAWCEEIAGDLPQREAVVRSLLTLRLLTYSPSGAPVAAPTTSLPEDPGGVRNWDYRFAWPRDASIGIGAFLGAGKAEEARRFLAWLLHATRLDRPRLPVLLTLHGKHPPPEHALDGWPGYARSVPVSVGNSAADQHQRDGYGWVLDAAWVLTQAGHGLYSETWRTMARFADMVAARWREPDAGIWEVRADPAHYVHSKLMAWLALDRALRIAGHHRISARRRRRWTAERDALASDVVTRGFDPDRGTFTRRYGAHDLDAALLVLPLLEMEPAGSPRVGGTIEAIRHDLGAGGPLLYRYPPGEDGLPGAEGAFLPCSFWLVQALARTGRSAEAAEQLEALVALGSPLGLFAEEMEPGTGRHLGNYPQAFTHATLVQAALALRRARDPSSRPSSGFAPA